MSQEQQQCTGKPMKTGRKPLAILEYTEYIVPLIITVYDPVKIAVMKSLYIFTLHQTKF